MRPVKCRMKPCFSSFFPYGWIALEDLSLLIVQVSRSHSDTPNSVSLLCMIGTSQRPLPDNTNIQKRQTSTPSAGFEPANPASKRQQTHALDRAATGIGLFLVLGIILCVFFLTSTRVILQLFLCLVEKRRV
jgi:hypothetical protein